MIDGCLCTFRADKATVKVYKSSSQAGRAAGVQGAALLHEIIAAQGYARIMVAASNSQFDVMASLVEDRRLKWNSIEVFHMDEYIGLPETHPASFRLWVKTRLELMNPNLKRREYPEVSLQRYPLRCCRVHAYLIFPEVSTRMVQTGTKPDKIL